MWNIICVLHPRYALSWETICGDSMFYVLQQQCSTDSIRTREIVFKNDVSGFNAWCANEMLMVDASDYMWVKWKGAIDIILLVHVVEVVCDLNVFYY